MTSSEHLPQSSGASSDSDACEPGVNLATDSWLADLHMAACRRWLSHDPPCTREAAEALRRIESICPALGEFVKSASGADVYRGGQSNDAGERDTLLVTLAIARSLRSQLQRHRN